MFLESSIFSSLPVVHGFGTLGEPVPAPFSSIWQRDRPFWKQVHAATDCEVTDIGQDCGEADILWTKQPGVPIGVITADCVPILLANESGTRVAAIHAGWRGTRARAIRRFWEKMKSSGESAASWRAAIGPAIGPCCYEVSEELVAEFRTEFSEIPAKRVSPSFRRLDLQAIHELELQSIGFARVDTLRYCTFCAKDKNEPLFHSFRREKVSTRQYSLIKRVPLGG